MVIATSGRIGSGKTTWAKEYALKNRFCYLSIDDCILNLYDECLGPMHNDTVSRIEKYFFEIILMNERASINTIIDDGYFTKERRKCLLDFCLENNVSLEFKYFDVSFEERLKRVLKRNELMINSKRREFIIDEEKLKKFDSIYEEEEKC